MFNISYVYQKLMEYDNRFGMRSLAIREAKRSNIGALVIGVILIPCREIIAVFYR